MQAVENLLKNGQQRCLWLLIIFLGVTFGAGIYEMRAVVPHWLLIPPKRDVRMYSTPTTWELTYGPSRWSQ